MKEKQRKLLTTALKISISALLLYFIFTKIDLSQVVGVIKEANPLWLVLALLFFAFSKVLNAFRLNLYFHAIGVQLTQVSNLKLYLLGMFYNLFLPGGIGGDAYKGYAIQKKFKVGTKKVVSVLLLDRLSGMLLILILSLLLASLAPLPIPEYFDWLLWTAIPLGVVVFWLFHKKWFDYVLPVFWGSFWYSAVIQILQLVAVYFLMMALDVSSNIVSYLMIFMVSSIVSVIPLTIGGIGSREVTFLYGSKWLELDANTAIGISFVFFLITALVSLFGIVYHFRKPPLQIRES